MNTMPISELIEQVTEICKKNGVKRLDLFGSFATGTSTPTSDIDFVLEGTVMNYNLTFDIAWKVMKDILVKRLEILDFAVGSPRETLQQAFTNRIIEDDRWMQMLKVRNQLAHDYDGSFACEMFADIVNVYCPLFEKFRDSAAKYYE